MSDQTTFDAARARRTYTLTAHVTVYADADLSDPFTRFAVFRALADRLSAAPLELDTPHGAATADIGLVTPPCPDPFGPARGVEPPPHIAAFRAGTAAH